jgi:hypothetical protein
MWLFNMAEHKKSPFKYGTTQQTFQFLIIQFSDFLSIDPALRN